MASTLSQTDAPRGLPRGRGSLPPQVVADAQRERLLRGAVSAVADLGYANVRIADIVERARVSRQSFYGQFADKEECFLAAHAAGVSLIMMRLGAWAASLRDPDPRAVIQGAIETYLGLVRDEPEFAYCMLVELQATGAVGLAARLDAHQRIAELIRAWHTGARAAHPDWPAVSPTRYAAAVGAVHDLVFAAVAGPHDAGADLAEAATDVVMALLQLPPQA